uniref:Fibronectin type-III domain-containing protein n=1 Tax=Gasterosteus aculeatus aculeatus TaxID=481459 RepID=A0AAQ4RN76_GASAC|nr:oncostatin-M-specific receptor subunit beta [Gasterosteus aculeatus aculeatus]
METLKGRSSLHEHIVVLVFLITVSQGSACEPPSTPECFKRRIEDTFFICEWSTKTNNPNVTFDIHIGEKKFNTSKTTCSILQEVIIIYHPVDIWVEARVGNSSCVSTNRSVVLSRIVKSEAPQNIGMSWSKNNLKLNWTAAGYPVLCEVLFRRSDYLTWENRTTDAAIESSFKHLTLTNLSKDSVYLLQVRCRYNGPKKDLVSLWSDWSPVVTVPAELEHKPEVTITTELLNRSRKVTLEWKAMPHAKWYILNDTQSSRQCPCKKKKAHNTTRSTHTIYVSLSAVDIWVFAQNSAGSSPPAIVQIPAESVAGLTICDKTALDEKFDRKTCREWYEHQDGDTMSQNRIRMKNKKRGEIGKHLTDYVRYLFFEHKRADGKPQTVKMCFFYQKEGVPRKEPQDLTSLTETKTSANLSWKEIPSADQRGFLTHYTLCILKVPSQDEVKECRNISASVTEHYVENLLPGGKYDIVLAGVTRAGKGPEATVTISTLPEDSWMHVWWSVGMLFLFFFLTMICTCILKRIQNKIFPHVPKPVVQDFNPYQPESGEFLEGKEEVDELTLHHLPEVKPAPEDAEETTVLTREWDDGSDLDDRVDSMMSEGISDECLGSTDEAMRSPRGGEMNDRKQIDNEIAMLIYRNGLVFDIKTDSP